jgi:hypothetical protein
MNIYVKSASAYIRQACSGDLSLSVGHLDQIAEGEQQQQVTIARPPSLAPELNPFAALDMKCFFPANLFEAAVHAQAQAQAEAQAQAQASLQLNLGYQLAPPGAGDAAHYF